KKKRQLGSQPWCGGMRYGCMLTRPRGFTVSVAGLAPGILRGGCMANEQRFAGRSCGLGPHASRRGLLQVGLAIGTPALGQRAALAQAGGAHDHHTPDFGVAKLPMVPAMAQPLVEPEARRSANGELRTSLRCAYAYRDIGGFRLYLRSYEGGLAPT